MVSLIAASVTTVLLAKDAIDSSTPVQETGEWKLVVGGTYAKPKLTKANRQIHSVEYELRQVAPQVERFQDWSDVINGSVGFGISRKVKFAGITFWPELYVDYAKGSIETKQNGLPTVLGTTLNYRFKDTYQTIIPQFGLNAEVMKARNLTLLFGSYITVGFFSDSTTFASTIPEVPASRQARVKFNDVSPGFSVASTLTYDFSKAWSCSIVAMYTWQKFSGKATVTDATSGPVSATSRYRTNLDVDITGPAFQLKIERKFSTF